MLRAALVVAALAVAAAAADADCEEFSTLVAKQVPRGQAGPSSGWGLFMSMPWDWALP